jgi:predicted RNase H-like nuclease
VAGVDGCRSGWVVATWPAAGRAGTLRLEVVPDFDQVADRVDAGELGLVAVDMPIGLADSGPRPCDRAARRLLGPRRSSVFPTPVRPVLACTTYAEALESSRQACGVGLPKQAWFLVPKLREVDGVMRRVQPGRIVEVSPELSFAALAGAPLAHPKRTLEGRRTRRDLLTPVFLGLEALLRDRYPGTAPDDLLDACALAWSARRIYHGEGCRVGDESDGTGLPMTISW